MILSLIRKKNIGLGINGIKLNDYLELYISKEETLVYIVPSSNRLGNGPFDKIVQEEFIPFEF